MKRCTISVPATLIFDVFIPERYDSDPLSYAKQALYNGTQWSDNLHVDLEGPVISGSITVVREHAIIIDTKEEQDI